MLRPATLEDARSLAPRLRKADQDELRALGMTDMEKALVDSIEVTEEPLAYEVDGVVHALCGCATWSGFGAPWLLGSDEVFTFKRDLMTYPKELLPKWLAKHGLLVNMVHVKNTRSIRWLKRLGFTVDDPVPLPSGALFRPFHLGGNYV